jgi:enoyl-CoA hydratase/carnithine racemase
MVRADKMNALDNAMFEALASEGEKLKTRKDVRVVVLSGEGRAFCAGLDTSNFAAMATGESRASAGLVTPQRTPGGANRAQHAVMVWREIPVPVIAAVHGVAFGGGLQVALGADLRLVAPDTRMSVMEIKWGLIPDSGPRADALAKCRRAARTHLLGRIFSGEEALKFGFATNSAPTAG